MNYVLRARPRSFGAGQIEGTLGGIAAGFAGFAVMPAVIGCGLIGIVTYISPQCPAVVPVTIGALAFLAARGLAALEGRWSARTPAQREELFSRTVAIGMLALAVLQISLLLTGSFEPRNDLSYICSAARSHVLRGVSRIYESLPPEHSHYFAVYPNNHMLYLLVYTQYRIWYFLTGHISNVPLIVMNTLSLDIAYLIACRCARLLYSPERAAVCAIRGLMFTPLVTYAGVFYTDAVSVLPVTLAVWLYIRAARSEGRGRYILLGLTALVLGAAFKLKGSAGVLLIAMLMDQALKGKGPREKLLPGAVMVPVFAAVCMALSALGNSVLHITPEDSERYRFPLEHWVMMSADGDGGYSREDFDYTRSFTTLSDKREADLQRLSIKLHRQGPLGFGAHLLRKMAYTYRDCTFMASYYTSHPALRSLPVLGLSMLCHFTLLFSAELSLIRGRAARGEKTVLVLSLLGIVAFLLIWETRCRYLISFFAVFMLL